MARLVKLGNCLCSCLTYPKYAERVLYIGIRNYASRNKHNIKGGSYTIYLKDKRMGYIDDPEDEDKSTVDTMADGLKIIKEGIPEFKREMKQKLKMDTQFDFEAVHGDYEYIFQADNKESMKDWTVSTDADNHQGKSSASFSVSPSDKALFNGVMRPDIPKDGMTRKLGFCNLRSPYKVKSFDRQSTYNWTMFTHLMLRVRGDGRNYMLNIHPYRQMDYGWMDLYQYPLYTRGGPYWQFVKIPFSSFFLSAVGRMQDKQEMVNLEQILCFSINAMDYYGAFHLEIDYIVLFHDEKHKNIHLYELYERSPYDV